MANRNQRPDNMRDRRHREPNEHRTPRYAPGHYPTESHQVNNYRNDFSEEQQDRFSDSRHSGYEPRGSQRQQYEHYQDRNTGRLPYEQERQFEDHQDYDPYRPQQSYRGGYRQEENEYPANRQTDRGSSYGYRETPYRQQSQDMQHYRDRDNSRDNDRNWWDRTRDEVSFWFGDENAEHRRAQDMYQNNGIYKGVGPKGYHRSDDRIKDDINDRLSDDAYVDASDIDVAVENGEVTLSGKVMSRDIKRRAEDIAESVSGISNVENRIRVNTHSFSKESQQTNRTESSETSQQRLQKKG